uniref:NADH dehydrogenase [ubiquinone] flavoprotein 3, mitochondrial n=1 Tax=Ascaris lumbricoides TaxID=6252 RepID=A0A0M3I0R2_ASCLU
MRFGKFVFAALIRGVYMYVHICVCLRLPSGKFIAKFDSESDTKRGVGRWQLVGRCAMTSLLRVLTVVALVSLLHCAYSAAQHRFYLRLTEQPFTQLPADIIVQTLVSLIVLIYGASHIAGDFQPIRSDIQVLFIDYWQDNIGGGVEDGRGEEGAYFEGTFNVGITDGQRRGMRLRGVVLGRCARCCCSLLTSPVFEKSLYTIYSAHYSVANFSTLIPRSPISIFFKYSASSQKLLNKSCIGYVDSRCRYLSSFPKLSASTVEHKTESTIDPHKKLNSPNFMQPSGKSKPESGKKAPSRLRSSVDNKSAMSALDHCIALTRNRDFANYIAALLMPTEVQPSVFAVLQLLAFNVELAVIRDQIERNTGTAGIYRLQFWKDTIEAIYGDRGGPIPKQPVALALQCFVRDVDMKLLSCLVLARQQTLGDRPFKSIEAVQQYGIDTYGALMKLLMRVLAQNRERMMHAIGKPFSVVINEEALEVVDLLAGAMALVTLLRSSIPLLSRGIILLPDDFMHLHGLSADSFYRRAKPEAMKSLAKDISLVRLRLFCWFCWVVVDELEVKVMTSSFDPIPLLRRPSHYDNSSTHVLTNFHCSARHFRVRTFLDELASSLLDRSREKRDEVPCAVRSALLASGATVEHLVRILYKCDFNLFDARLQRGANLLAWRLWWRSILGRY